MKIKITNQEQEETQLNDNHLNLALQHLRELGVVILENAISFTFYQARRTTLLIQNKMSSTL